MDRDQKREGCPEREAQKRYPSAAGSVYAIVRAGISLACVLFILALAPCRLMSAEGGGNGAPVPATANTQPSSGSAATGGSAGGTSAGPTGSQSAQPVGAEQQPSGETQGPQPAAPSRPRTQAAGGVGRGAMQGGSVSFNFDDADVYSVIQTVFGDLLRVNYVVDPKVKGRVTFRSVSPVPRENVLPIMEVILRLNGIGMVEEAGLFRIIQITDIAKEPAPIQFGRDPGKVTVSGKSLLQVIPILNTQSTEIVKLISSFVSTNAVIIDVPRGNHIIVVDTDANVRRLLELVQIFDGDEFKGRKGEVHVYPVQYSKAKDIVALLQQIFLGGSSSLTSPAGTSPTTSRTTTPTPAQAPRAGQTTPTPPTAGAQAPTIVGGGTGLVSEMTRIFADEVTNSVIIVGTPEDYSIIKEAIQKIDIIRRQVILEGMIAEVTLTDNLSLGLAYSLKATMNSIGLKGQIGLNPSELAAATSTTNPTTGATTTTAPVFSGSGFQFMGVDEGGVVRAMVSALASQSRAKLLAAPHILVADNHEARIQVGQQVPIVTSETIATTVVSAQQTIQYKDIGIILKVKPQVNENGLVSLEIDQEISSFSTTKLFSDSTQIIVDKTQATTELIVGDGKTIVIGGLIREDTNKNDSGIPFLHKIPILGYLFGEKSRDTTRKELLILLTPHVIHTQDQAQDVTNTYIDKFSDRGSIKKEDLTNRRANPNKKGADSAK